MTELVILQVDERQPHSVLLRELAAPARVLEVMRNGRPEPWELLEAGGGQRLRIGARGKALSHGRHLYRIAYSAAGRVKFLDYHDEVRWTVPAAARITAEVSLPASVPARDLRIDATGDGHASFLGDGRAAFRSAKEPMSITERFPKGVVSAPEFDYRGLGLVLAGLLAAGAALLWIKARAARSPRQAGA